MTQELKEKIRDTLSVAYQVGFMHKSAGNTAYLEVDEVLDALMDSIVLAEKDKVEIPKPDHTTEVEEDIAWGEGCGCLGCICKDCVYGPCGEDCDYSNVSRCGEEHPNEVIKECKHFEEME